MSGAAGASTVQRRTGTQTNISASDTALVTASCQSGEWLASGGFDSTEPASVQVQQSFPSDTPLAGTWTTDVWNDGSSAMTVTPYALCVS